MQPFSKTQNLQQERSEIATECLEHILSAPHRNSISELHLKASLELFRIHFTDLWFTVMQPVADEFRERYTAAAG